MPRSDNASGIPLRSHYDQPAGIPHDLGEPGAFPYGRGIRKDMYRGRLWTMRQYAGFATAAESNERYRYLLERGQTGLSVAFDLPTQLGYDSDAAAARGEVGKVGVAIDTIDDMETLLAGIPLDRVTVSMTINAPASILLAMLLATARRRGVPFDKLGGTIQNDVLKEYAARGTYIYPPVPSMRLVTDVMQYCAREVPQWNTISISGYHIREAGSTAVEEIAFALANGKAYLQAARDAGIDLDEIAPRLSFFWNAHNDFFEEVAKFRAARYIWAHITRDEFGCKDPRSHMLRFHTQTGARRLPHRNRRTTSSGSRCKPSRRCSAARSRCTPTARTKRWRCPPSKARNSRCARSRSSATNPASPTSSIRWPDRTTWNRSPTN